MSQIEVTNAIAKASAKGFQRTSTLIRKYGVSAAIDGMDAVMAAYPDRLRVYGKEAGGIGPSR